MPFLVTYTYSYLDKEMEFHGDLTAAFTFDAPDPDAAKQQLRDKVNADLATRTPDDSVILVATTTMEFEQLVRERVRVVA